MLKLGCRDRAKSEFLGSEGCLGRLGDLKKENELYFLNDVGLSKGKNWWSSDNYPCPLFGEEGDLPPI